MKISVVICLFLSIGTFAGNEGGNGGLVVRCVSPHSVNYELLDFYEARVLPPYLNISFSASSVEYEVLRLINRLERRDPVRAKKYLEKMQEFFSGNYTVWIDNLELPYTEDTGFVPLLGYCNKFEQAVWQQTPLFPSDRRYLIQRGIWNQLGGRERTGLVLHEILYGEALSLGQQTSKNVRRFLSILASQKFFDITQSDYEKLAANTFAVIPNVAFLSDYIETGVEKGKPFSLDLSRFLASKGSGNLKWTFYKLPPGVNLGEDTGILSGSVLTDSQLVVIVSDGIYSVASTLTLRTFIPSQPAWTIHFANVHWKKGQPNSLELASLISSDSPDWEVSLNHSAALPWLGITNGSVLRTDFAPIQGGNYPVKILVRRGLGEVGKAQELNISLTVE